MFNHNHPFRKVLRTTALVTSLVFTFTSLGWANGINLFDNGRSVSGSDQGFNKLGPNSGVERTFEDLLSLPEEYGSIKTSYKGYGDEVVIHIQDAHINEEAQLNIGNIIKYYADKHGMSLVNLEGAEGELYTDIYKIFENREARKGAAEYFLKQGRLTGPEYMAVVESSDVILNGVEDRALYDENRDAYLSVMSRKERDEKVLADLYKLMDMVSRYVFSPEVRELNEKRLNYQAGGHELVSYVSALFEEAKAQGIDVGDYAGMHALLDLIRLEGEVEFEGVEKQLSSALREMKKKLPRESLTRFLSNMVHYRMKKMSKTAYFGYLMSEMDRLKAKDRVFGTQYSNVRKYIEYMKLYESVGVELFEEIEQLDQRVKEKLLTSEEEKGLDRLYRIYDIYEKMFSFNLTKQDVEFFYANREDFQSEKLTSYLTPILKKHHFSYSLPMNMEVLDQDLPSVETFYAKAIERDEVMIKRSMEKAKEGHSVSAIVAGGFHTAGIEKYLYDNHISHITIAPRISQAIDERKEAKLYDEALRAKPLKITQVIEEAFLPQAGQQTLNDPRYQLVAWRAFKGKEELTRQGYDYALFGALGVSVLHADKALNLETLASGDTKAAEWLAGAQVYDGVNGMSGTTVLVLRDENGKSLAVTIGKGTTSFEKRGERAPAGTNTISYRVVEAKDLTEAQFVLRSEKRMGKNEDLAALGATMQAVAAKAAYSKVVERFRLLQEKSGNLLSEHAYRNFEAYASQVFGVDAEGVTPEFESGFALTQNEGRSRSKTNWERDYQQLLQLIFVEMVRLGFEGQEDVLQPLNAYAENLGLPKQEDQASYLNERFKALLGATPLANIAKGKGSEHPDKVNFLSNLTSALRDAKFAVQLHLMSSADGEDSEFFKDFEETIMWEMSENYPEAALSVSSNEQYRSIGEFRTEEEKKPTFAELKEEEDKTPAPAPVEEAASSEEKPAMAETVESEVEQNLRGELETLLEDHLYNSVDDAVRTQIRAAFEVLVNPLTESEDVTYTPNENVQREWAATFVVNWILEEHRGKIADASFQSKLKGFIIARSVSQEQLRNSEHIDNLTELRKSLAPETIQPPAPKVEDEVPLVTQLPDSRTEAATSTQTPKEPQIDESLSPGVILFNTLSVILKNIDGVNFDYDSRLKQLGIETRQEALEVFKLALKENLDFVNEKSVFLNPVNVGQELQFEFAALDQDRVTFTFYGPFGGNHFMLTVGQFKNYKQRVQAGERAEPTGTVDSSAPVLPGRIVGVVEESVQEEIEAASELTVPLEVSKTEDVSSELASIESKHRIRSEKLLEAVGEDMKAKLQAGEFEAKAKLLALEAFSEVDRVALEIESVTLVSEENTGNEITVKVKASIAPEKEEGSETTQVWEAAEQVEWEVTFNKLTHDIWFPEVSSNDVELRQFVQAFTSEGIKLPTSGETRYSHLVKLAEDNDLNIFEILAGLNGAIKRDVDEGKHPELLLEIAKIYQTRKDSLKNQEDAAKADPKADDDTVDYDYADRSAPLLNIASISIVEDTIIRDNDGNILEAEFEVSYGLEGVSVENVPSRTAPSIRLALDFRQSLLQEAFANAVSPVPAPEAATPKKKASTVKKGFLAALLFLMLGIASWYGFANESFNKTFKPLIGGGKAKETTTQVETKEQPGRVERGLKFRMHSGKPGTEPDPNLPVQFDMNDPNSQVSIWMNGYLEKFAKNSKNPETVEREKANFRERVKLVVDRVNSAIRNKEILENPKQAGLAQISTGIDLVAARYGLLSDEKFEQLIEGLKRDKKTLFEEEAKNIVISKFIPEHFLTGAEEGLSNKHRDALVLLFAGMKNVSLEGLMQTLNDLERGQYDIEDRAEAAYNAAIKDFDKTATESMDGDQKLRASINTIDKTYAYLIDLEVSILKVSDQNKKKAYLKTLAEIESTYREKFIAGNYTQDDVQSYSDNLTTLVAVVKRSLTEQRAGEVSEESDNKSASLSEEQKDKLLNDLYIDLLPKFVSTSVNPAEALAALPTIKNEEDRQKVINTLGKFLELPTYSGKYSVVEVIHAAQAWLTENDRKRHGQFETFKRLTATLENHVSNHLASRADSIMKIAGVEEPQVIIAIADEIAEILGETPNAEGLTNLNREQMLKALKQAIENVKPRFTGRDQQRLLNDSKNGFERFFTRAIDDHLKGDDYSGTATEAELLEKAAKNVTTLAMAPSQYQNMTYDQILFAVLMKNEKVRRGVLARTKAEGDALISRNAATIDFPVIRFDRSGASIGIEIYAPLLDPSKPKAKDYAHAEFTRVQVMNKNEISQAVSEAKRLMNDYRSALAEAQLLKGIQALVESDETGVKELIKQRYELNPEGPFQFTRELTGFSASINAAEGLAVDSKRRLALLMGATRLGDISIHPSYLTDVKLGQRHTDDSFDKVINEELEKLGIADISVAQDFKVNLAEDVAISTALTSQMNTLFTMARQRPLLALNLRAFWGFGSQNFENIFGILTARSDDPLLASEFDTMNEEAMLKLERAINEIDHQRTLLFGENGNNGRIQNTIDTLKNAEANYAAALKEMEAQLVIYKSGGSMYNFIPSVVKLEEAAKKLEFHKKAVRSILDKASEMNRVLTISDQERADQSAENGAAYRRALDEIRAKRAAPGIRVDKPLGDWRSDITQPDVRNVDVEMAKLKGEKALDRLSRVLVAPKKPADMVLQGEKRKLGERVGSALNNVGRFASGVGKFFTRKRTDLGESFKDERRAVEANLKKWNKEEQKALTKEEREETQAKRHAEVKKMMPFLFLSSANKRLHDKDNGVVVQIERLAREIKETSEGLTKEQLKLKKAALETSKELTERKMLRVAEGINKKYGDRGGNLVRTVSANNAVQLFFRLDGFGNEVQGAVGLAIGARLGVEEAGLIESLIHEYEAAVILESAHYKDQVDRVAKTDARIKNINSRLIIAKADMVETEKSIALVDAELKRRQITGVGADAAKAELAGLQKKKTTIEDNILTLEFELGAAKKQYKYELGYRKADSVRWNLPTTVAEVKNLEAFAEVVTKGQKSSESHRGLVAARVAHFKPTPSAFFGIVPVDQNIHISYAEEQFLKHMALNYYARESKGVPLELILEAQSDGAFAQLRSTVISGDEKRQIKIDDEVTSAHALQAFHSLNETLKRLAVMGKTIVPKTYENTEDQLDAAEQIWNDARQKGRKLGGGELQDNARKAAQVNARPTALTQTINTSDALGALDNYLIALLNRNLTKMDRDLYGNGNVRFPAAMKAYNQVEDRKRGAVNGRFTFSARNIENKVKPHVIAVPEMLGFMASDRVYDVMRQYRVAGYGQFDIFGSYDNNGYRLAAEVSIDPISAALSRRTHMAFHHRAEAEHLFRASTNQARLMVDLSSTDYMSALALYHFWGVENKWLSIDGQYTSGTPLADVGATAVIGRFLAQSELNKKTTKRAVEISAAAAALAGGFSPDVTFSAPQGNGYLRFFTTNRPTEHLIQKLDARLKPVMRQVEELEKNEKFEALVDKIAVAREGEKQSKRNRLVSRATLGYGFGSGSSLSGTDRTTGDWTASFEVKYKIYNPYLRKLSNIANIDVILLQAQQDGLLDDISHELIMSWVQVIRAYDKLLAAQAAYMEQAKVSSRQEANYPEGITPRNLKIDALTREQEEELGALEAGKDFWKAYALLNSKLDLMGAKEAVLGTSGVDIETVKPAADHQFTRTLKEEAEIREKLEGLRNAMNAPVNEREAKARFVRRMVEDLKGQAKTQTEVSDASAEKMRKADPEKPYEPVLDVENPEHSHLRGAGTRLLNNLFGVDLPRGWTEDDVALLDDTAPAKIEFVNGEGVRLHFQSDEGWVVMSLEIHNRDHRKAVRSKVGSEDIKFGFQVGDKGIVQILDSSGAFLGTANIDPKKLSKLTADRTKTVESLSAVAKTGAMTQERAMKMFYEVGHSRYKENDDVKNYYRLYIMNRLSQPGQDLGNWLRSPEFQSLLANHPKHAGLGGFKGARYETYFKLLERVEFSKKDPAAHDAAIDLRILELVDYLASRFMQRYKDSVSAEAYDKQMKTDAKWVAILNDPSKSAREKEVAQAALDQNAENMFKFLDAQTTHFSDSIKIEMIMIKVWMKAYQHFVSGEEPKPLHLFVSSEDLAFLIQNGMMSSNTKTGEERLDFNEWKTKYKVQGEESYVQQRFFYFVFNNWNVYRPRDVSEHFLGEALTESDMLKTNQEVYELLKAYIYSDEFFAFVDNINDEGIYSSWLSFIVSGPLNSDDDWEKAKQRLKNIAKIMGYLRKNKSENYSYLHGPISDAELLERPDSVGLRAALDGRKFRGEAGSDLAAIEARDIEATGLNQMREALFEGESVAFTMLELERYMEKGRSIEGLLESEIKKIQIRISNRYKNYPAIISYLEKYGLIGEVSLYNPEHVGIISYFYELMVNNKWTPFQLELFIKSTAKFREHVQNLNDGAAGNANALMASLGNNPAIIRQLQRENISASTLLVSLETGTEEMMLDVPGAYSLISLTSERADVSPEELSLLIGAVRELYGATDELKSNDAKRKRWERYSPEKREQVISDTLDAASRIKNNLKAFYDSDLPADSELRFDIHGETGDIGKLMAIAQHIVGEEGWEEGAEALIKFNNYKKKLVALEADPAAPPITASDVLNEAERDAMIEYQAWLAKPLSDRVQEMNDRFASALAFKRDPVLMSKLKLIFKLTYPGEKFTLRSDEGLAMGFLLSEVKRMKGENKSVDEIKDEYDQVLKVLNSPVYNQYLRELGVVAPDKTLVRELQEARPNRKAGTGDANKYYKLIGRVFDAAKSYDANFEKELKKKTELLIMLKAQYGGNSLSGLQRYLFKAYGSVRFEDPKTGEKISLFKSKLDLYKLLINKRSLRDYLADDRKSPIDRGLIESLSEQHSESAFQLAFLEGELAGLMSLMQSTGVSFNLDDAGKLTAQDKQLIAKHTRYYFELLPGFNGYPVFDIANGIVFDKAYESIHGRVLQEQGTEIEDLLEQPESVNILVNATADETISGTVGYWLRSVIEGSNQDSPLSVSEVVEIIGNIKEVVNQYHATWGNQSGDKTRNAYGVKLTPQNILTIALDKKLTREDYAEYFEQGQFIQALAVGSWKLLPEKYQAILFGMKKQIEENNLGRPLTFDELHGFIQEYRGAALHGHSLRRAFNIAPRLMANRMSKVLTLQPSKTHLNVAAAADQMDPFIGSFFFSTNASGNPIDAAQNSSWWTQLPEGEQLRFLLFQGATSLERNLRADNSQVVRDALLEYAESNKSDLSLEDFTETFDYLGYVGSAYRSQTLTKYILFDESTVNNDDQLKQYILLRLLNRPATQEIKTNEHKAKAKEGKKTFIDFLLAENDFVKSLPDSVKADLESQSPEFIYAILNDMDTVVEEFVRENRVNINDTKAFQEKVVRFILNLRLNGAVESFSLLEADILKYYLGQIDAEAPELSRGARLMSVSSFVNTQAAAFNLNEVLTAENKEKFAAAIVDKKLTRADLQLIFKDIEALVKLASKHNIPNYAVMDFDEIVRLIGVSRGLSVENMGLVSQEPLQRLETNEQRYREALARENSGIDLADQLVPAFQADVIANNPALEGRVPSEQLEIERKNAFKTSLRNILLPIAGIFVLFSILIGLIAARTTQLQQKFMPPNPERNGTLSAVEDAKKNGHGDRVPQGKPNPPITLREIVNLSVRIGAAVGMGFLTFASMNALVGALPALVAMSVLVGLLSFMIVGHIPTAAIGDWIFLTHADLDSNKRAVRNATYRPRLDDFHAHDAEGRRIADKERGEVPGGADTEIFIKKNVPAAQSKKSKKDSQANKKVVSLKSIEGQEEFTIKEGHTTAGVTFDFNVVKYPGEKMAEWLSDKMEQNIEYFELMRLFEEEFGKDMKGTLGFPLDTSLRNLTNNVDPQGRFKFAIVTEADAPMIRRGKADMKAGIDSKDARHYQLLLDTLYYVRRQAVITGQKRFGPSNQYYNQAKTNDEMNALGRELFYAFPLPERHKAKKMFNVAAMMEVVMGQDGAPEFDARNQASMTQLRYGGRYNATLSNIISLFGIALFVGAAIFLAAPLLFSVMAPFWAWFALSIILMIAFKTGSVVADLIIRGIITASMDNRGRPTGIATKLVNMKPGIESKNFFINELYQDEYEGVGTDIYGTGGSDFGANLDRTWRNRVKAQNPDGSLKKDKHGGQVFEERRDGVNHMFLHDNKNILPFGIVRKLVEMATNKFNWAGAIIPKTKIITDPKDRTFYTMMQDFFALLGAFFAWALQKWRGNGNLSGKALINVKSYYGFGDSRNETQPWWSFVGWQIGGVVLGALAVSLLHLPISAFFLFAFLGFAGAMIFTSGSEGAHGGTPVKQLSHDFDEGARIKDGTLTVENGFILEGSVASFFANIPRAFIRWGFGEWFRAPTSTPRPGSALRNRDQDAISAGGYYNPILYGKWFFMKLLTIPLFIGLTNFYNGALQPLITYNTQELLLNSWQAGGLVGLIMAIMTAGLYQRYSNEEMEEKGYDFDTLDGRPLSRMVRMMPSTVLSVLALVGGFSLKAFGLASALVWGNFLIVVGVVFLAVVLTVLFLEKTGLSRHMNGFMFLGLIVAFSAVSTWAFTVLGTLGFVLLPFSSPAVMFLIIVGTALAIPILFGKLQSAIYAKVTGFVVSTVTATAEPFLHIQKGWINIHKVLIVYNQRPDKPWAATIFGKWFAIQTYLMRIGMVAFPLALMIPATNALIIGKIVAGLTFLSGYSFGVTGVIAALIATPVGVVIASILLGVVVVSLLYKYQRFLSIFLRENQEQWATFTDTRAETDLLRAYSIIPSFPFAVILVGITLLFYAQFWLFVFGFFIVMSWALSPWVNWIHKFQLPVEYPAIKDGLYAGFPGWGAVLKGVFSFKPWQGLRELIPMRWRMTISFIRAKSREEVEKANLKAEQYVSDHKQKDFSNPKGFYERLYNLFRVMDRSSVVQSTKSNMRFHQGFSIGLKLMFLSIAVIIGFHILTGLGIVAGGLAFFAIPAAFILPPLVGYLFVIPSRLYSLVQRTITDFVITYVGQESNTSKEALGESSLIYKWIFKNIPWLITDYGKLEPTRMLKPNERFAATSAVLGRGVLFDTKVLDLMDRDRSNAFKGALRYAASSERFVRTLAGIQGNKEKILRMKDEGDFEQGQDLESDVEDQTIGFKYEFAWNSSLSYEGVEVYDANIWRNGDLIASGQYQVIDDPSTHKRYQSVNNWGVRARVADANKKDTEEKKGPLPAILPISTPATTPTTAPAAELPGPREAKVERSKVVTVYGEDGAEVGSVALNDKDTGEAVSDDSAWNLFAWVLYQKGHIKADDVESAKAFLAGYIEVLNQRLQNDAEFDPAQIQPGKELTLGLENEAGEDYSVTFTFTKTDGNYLAFNIDSNAAVGTLAVAVPTQEDESLAVDKTDSTPYAFEAVEGKGVNVVDRETGEPVGFFAPDAENKTTVQEEAGLMDLIQRLIDKVTDESGQLENIQAGQIFAIGNVGANSFSGSFQATSENGQFTLSSRNVDSGTFTLNIKEEVAAEPQTAPSEPEFTFAKNIHADENLRTGMLDVASRIIDGSLTINTTVDHPNGFQVSFGDKKETFAFIRREGYGESLFVYPVTLSAGQSPSIADAPIGKLDLKRSEQRSEVRKVSPNVDVVSLGEALNRVKAFQLEQLIRPGAYSAAYVQALIDYDGIDASGIVVEQHHQNRIGEVVTWDGADNATFIRSVIAHVGNSGAKFKTVQIIAKPGEEVAVNDWLATLEDVDTSFVKIVTTSPEDAVEAAKAALRVQGEADMTVVRITDEVTSDRSKHADLLVPVKAGFVTIHDVMRKVDGADFEMTISQAIMITVLAEEAIATSA